MKLVSMKLQNFCGMAQAECEFGERTIIEAMNGQGKSTYATAYKWVLGFDFNEIYPVLAPSNVRIGTSDKPIVTMVQATFEKDGLTYVLKRVSNQKWKVNRDSGISEFTGNECKYYMDSESDCNASTYKEKIASLFGCKHSELEVVLDISYFNADTAKHGWQTRRKFLFEKLDIAGLVKNLANDEAFDLLRNDLLKGTKDEIDIQKSLNAEKSSIKTEQERNLTLIEDKMKQLAVYQAIDLNGLKVKLAELQAQYEKLLTQSNKTNKNTIIAEMQDKLNKLQAELRKEQDSIYRQERELSNKKFELESRNMRVQSDIKGYENDILTIKYENEQYERGIAELTEHTFDSESKNCKVCGQLLPSNMIDELIVTFETYKSKSLSDSRLKVENNNRMAQNIIGKIKELTEQLQGLQSQLKALESEVIDKSKITTLETEIAELSDKISQLKMAEVKDTVAEKIEALKTEMATINRELGKEAIVDDIKNAIETLKAQSLKLTAQEANRLRKQAQLKDYVLRKVELVNDSVNKWFDNDVSFLFFEYNGANADNEFTNTCTALYRGIPYSKASNGERIFTDIAVNNGIKKILNVSAPTFVDNFEAVTKPIESQDQLILLKVAENKKLENILRVSDVYNLADCVERK